MSSPIKPKMSEEDSAAVEAYGVRGAAMRKTAAKMSEGLESAPAETKSFVKRGLDKVRHIFERDAS
ncbi:MAG TPA: hypothetical protein VF944_09380 [Candidatus Bathyarchaeia archaeon]